MEEIKNKVSNILKNKCNCQVLAFGNKDTCGYSQRVENYLSNSGKKFKELDFKDVQNDEIDYVWIETNPEIRTILNELEGPKKLGHVTKPYIWIKKPDGTLKFIGGCNDFFSNLNKIENYKIKYYKYLKKYLSN